MQDFRNLTVWRRARALTASIYTITRSFPRSEEFGLKAQMRRASVSICSNLAEGCGRRGDREFRRYVDVAMGSACELECEVVLSHDLGLLERLVCDRTVAEVIVVKRMLSALAARLAPP